MVDVRRLPVGEDNEVTVTLDELAREGACRSRPGTSGWRRGTSGRRWSNCSARTPPACRPRRSVGCARSGRPSTRSFRARELRFCQYAYWFVDGVHVSVRLGEDDRLCLLVVIGVREDSTKELLAVEDGYRESTESWAAVMRDLKARGLNEPKLVIGDGALGTWACGGRPATTTTR